MQSSRTRTSLSRTTFDVDMGLPPSPRSSLSDAMRRPTPRVISGGVNSPVIPVMEEFDEEIVSVPDLVRSQSLDEEIARSGYQTISKVIVTGSNKESTVPFVKVQNDLGEPFYIVVDVDDSYISQSNNDPIMRESRIPMKIQREDKETAFSSVGMAVSGVAMECKNGLCMIMHDEQMGVPLEQNYVLMHTKKMEETFALASYPIVRMSDLRTNPQACQKNIDLALRKMRNAALSKCLCKIESVQKKLDHVCKLFASTLECKEKIIREFHRTISLLECYHDDCMKCPEKNQDKLREINYNIEKRNAKFPYLMESCKEIASMESMLDETTMTLERAKMKMEKKFKYIHCAYELKKKCETKCVWDVKDDDMSSDEE